MTQRIENTNEVLGQDNAFAMLLVKALCQVERRSKKDRDALLERWAAGGWDVVFTIEGKKVDLKKIFEEWEKQFNALIDQRAVELIEKRVGDAMENVEDVLEEARRAIKKKLKEKAGITVGEED